MTIEILETRTINDLAGQPVKRHATIIISNGSGASYLWGVGDLPLAGDLQTILNGREAQLWAAARAGGRAADLYQLALKRVLKALALVMLDEINILRNQAGLAPRTALQIDNAIKAKLKAME